MASVTDSDDMVSKSNQRVEYFKRRFVSYLSMHVPSLPIIMIGALPIFVVVFFLSPCFPSDFFFNLAGR